MSFLFLSSNALFIYLSIVKGIFLQSDLKNDQKIYTTTGDPLLKDDEEF